MLCAEFEERLADHLDGTLDAERGLEVSRHAAECRACNDLLTDVVRSTELLFSVEAVREGMQGVAKDLGVKDIDWIAGIHIRA